MTSEEADKVFKAFQEYIEVADKLSNVFHKIPESFLPYPLPVMEEALNVVAKQYFDTGDKKTSRSIQELMAMHLGRVDKDKEALKAIKENLNLSFEHPELIDGKVSNLQRARDSWAEQRKKK